MSSPVSEIGRSMDPTPVLAKLSSLIQVLICLEENVEFHKASCESLVARIKLLKPLLHEVQASKAPLTEEAVTSFGGLENTLIKAKELLERCGGKASRFYVVLRGKWFTSKFHCVSMEIEYNLHLLPLATLQLSDQAHQQVEQCLQELKGAVYPMGSLEENLGKEVESALIELGEGEKISHDKLAYLRGRFGFKLNQELLREASLLEKEKAYVRIERDKVEEDCINQLIALMTQMSNDLSEQKQAQDVFHGISIPTDFRCPLSLELMSDPVIVASGQTYERAYIQQWLEQGNATCPKTRQPLSHKNLIPNYTVKALIANWCETQNVPFPEAAKVEIHELKQGLVCPLVSTELERDNAEHFQETVNVPRTSVDQTETLNSSKPAVRFMRTIWPRGYGEHESDRVAEVVFAAGEESRANSQINCRRMVDRDASGRGQATAPAQNGNQMGDHAGIHIRNSSLGSNIDGVHTKAVPDDNNLEAAQPRDASPCNDLSGELERLGVPVRVPAHFEDFGSPVRTVDQVSVNWRRNKDRDSRMPIIAPLPSLGTADDGENTALKVEQLVGELQSTSIDAQRTAAAELRLLAKYNMENRILIANCGSIGPLVTLLHSTDLKTQENAVTALLNLSINDNNKIEIAAAGAIDPLVNVLKVGNSEAKENAAATLFSLSVMDENKVAIGQCGAIGPLVDLLKHGTPRGKKDAATALFNLSIFHENKPRIVRAGAVRPLVELMSDPAAGMVDKAVAVLANLATTQEGRFAIGGEGGIPALVEVLELGSQRGKEHAAASLLQLCTNSNRFRSVVLQEGAIPPLVALSQSGTPRAKEKASALLRHFREQRHAAPGRVVPVRHIDQ